MPTEPTDAAARRADDRDRRLADALRLNPLLDDYTLPAVLNARPTRDSPSILFYVEPVDVDGGARAFEIYLAYPTTSSTGQAAWHAEVMATVVKTIDAVMIVDALRAYRERIDGR